MVLDLPSADSPPSYLILGLHVNGSTNLQTQYTIINAEHVNIIGNLLIAAVILWGCLSICFPRDHQCTHLGHSRSEAAQTSLTERNETETAPSEGS